MNWSFIILRQADSASSRCNRLRWMIMHPQVTGRSRDEKEIYAAKEAPALNYRTKMARMTVAPIITGASMHV